MLGLFTWPAAFLAFGLAAVGYFAVGYFMVDAPRGFPDSEKGAFAVPVEAG